MATKRAVTGVKPEIGDIHCHHGVPKHLGGTDECKKLIIVSEKKGVKIMSQTIN